MRSATFFNTSTLSAIVAFFSFEFVCVVALDGSMETEILGWKVVTSSAAFFFSARGRRFSFKNVGLRGPKFRRRRLGLGGMGNAEKEATEEEEVEGVFVD